jgi:hypothetical protein
MQTEKRIRKFYARWSPPLLAFCQLLVDQDADAERSVIEAFQAYASHGLDFDLLVLPALLFTFALDSVKKGEFPFRGKAQEPKRSERLWFAFLGRNAPCSCFGACWALRKSWSARL